MDPNVFDTNEASNMLRVFREALVVVRQRLSSTQLGELLKSNQEFNKQNLSLEELETALKNNQYQEVLPTLIKEMGGENNLDQWIKNTLLNESLKKLWTTEHLQSQPVFSNSDPRWLKDIAVAWQKEGNWQHTLETQSPQFNDFTWIGHFIFFLRLYARALERQIDVLDGEIDAAQKEDSDSQPTSQSVGVVSQPPRTINEPTKPTETPAEQEAAIRAKQQESVRKKKRAVVLARLRALNIANGKPALGDLALNNLERIIELSTLTGVDIDTLFAQYGLDTALLAIDPKVLATFKKYALEARSEFSDVNFQEGLSANVLRSADIQVNKDLQNSMLSIGKALGDDVIPLAYGAKLSTLRSRAQDGDVAAAKALKVYEKTIEGVWEPDKGTLKGALSSLTGTRREQEILLSNWGIKPSDKNEKITKVSQVIDHLSDKALADIFGIAPEEVLPTEQELGSESEKQPKEKKKSGVDPKRFKQFTDVTKSIALNPAAPFIAGGAAVAGVGLYGLVTQGIAGGVGAATVSLGGAIAGGVGGFFIGGPIGSVIGAVAGGLGSGAASLAWHPYGGASAAQIVGSAEAKAVGISLGINPNTVASTAGQTVTAGTKTAVSILPSSTALGAGTTNALSGISAGIQSLSSMPSIFSSIAATTVLVTGPIITAGFVTVSGGLVIASAFLVPQSGSNFRNSNGTPTGAGGCWPTTGYIWEAPYAPFSHRIVDAVDIGHGTGSHLTGEPIQTVYSGKLRFFASATSNVYGNYAVLLADAGNTFLFGHMVAFANGFSPNQEYTVPANTVIGYMGHTSNNPAYDYPGNEHLHYEMRDSGFNLYPPPSRLEALLPEPIITGDTPWGIPSQSGQYVRADQCASSTTAKPLTAPSSKGKVSCFSFIDGTKAWGTTNGIDEVSYYSDQLKQLTSDARINKVLCGSGNEIQVVRTESPSGLCTNGPDSPGAYVADAGSIHVCDHLFTDPVKFGKSTIWHEPGHIVQLKFTDWVSYFPDYKNVAGVGYIPTYPLGQQRDEDFAEAFGMCNATKISPGYRNNSTISGSDEPWKSNQCHDIDTFLNAKGL